MHGASISGGAIAKEPAIMQRAGRWPFGMKEHIHFWLQQSGGVIEPGIERGWLILGLACCALHLKRNILVACNNAAAEVDAFERHAGDVALQDRRDHPWPIHGPDVLEDDIADCEVRLAKLQERLGLTYVFISHDLAVVETIAHEVAVMHRGQVVEHAAAERIFADPQHAYTKLLLSSVPRLAAAADTLAH